MTPAENSPSGTECCGLDPSPSVEDYLKTVFAVTSYDMAASTSTIAARLGVTPSSASTMLGRLREAGLLEHAGWGQVRLSQHGLSHAHQVVRRHRLLETFLHQVLGMPWDEVHEEAEVLEHYVSSRVEALVDAALGHPDRDPHGDPIPRDAGGHEEHADTPLARCAAGDVLLVQRIFDTDSEALRHFASLGIQPGASLQVGPRVAGSVSTWVDVGGRRCSLSPGLVDLVHGRVLAAGEVVTTLDQLPRSARAVVTRLDTDGPDRRRLMDLGILPGTEILAQATSPLGDPTAYLVRDSLVALRRGQAQRIHVTFGGAR